MEKHIEIRKVAVVYVPWGWVLHRDDRYRGISSSSNELKTYWIKEDGEIIETGEAAARWRDDLR